MKDITIVDSSYVLIRQDKDFVILGYQICNGKSYKTKKTKHEDSLHIQYTRNVLEHFLYGGHVCTGIKITEKICPGNFPPQDLATFLEHCRYGVVD